MEENTIFKRFTEMEWTKKQDDEAVPAAQGKQQFAFVGVPRSKVQTEMRELWKFMADMIYLEPVGFYYHHT